MVELDTATDLEALRSSVFHLERTVKSLLRQNAKLQEENLRLKGLDAQQIHLVLDVEMNDSGAQASDDQQDGSQEKATASRGSKPPSRRRRSKGRTAQPNLAEIKVDVPLEPDTCPDCNKPVVAFDGWDTSKTVTVTRAVYEVKSERRQKGRCGCPDKVHVAPSTVLKMRSGGRYSVELTAHVVVNKWCDHLPLERQVRRMARSGLDVTPQALYDQSEALADELRPVYDALVDEMLASQVLAVDETSWKLLQKGGSEYRAAIGLSTPMASAFLFSPSKDTDVMERVLKPFSGTLVCDGLSVYSSLAKRRAATNADKIIIANCWAHAHRRFRDASGDFPVALKMMSLIGQLYDIDREAGPFPGDKDVRRRRGKLRSKKSTKVLAKIRRLALELLSVPKDLSIREAAAYLLNHWSGLTVFVRDPDVPLDNNGCERDLRQLVQGRKNHYGSGSEHGLATSAVLYSLIQTCLKLGVDPERYLVEAVRRRRGDPSEVYLPRHALEEPPDG